MIFRSVFRAALLATCCLVIQVNCFAQSNYGSLNGTILDPEHRAIASATIQLVSTSTRAVRQVTSNEQGLYQITALLPEEYQLNVQAGDEIYVAAKPTSALILRVLGVLSGVAGLAFFIFRIS
jgi:hypothetical protein